MKLGTAIEKLVENYNYAVGKEWVQDKVAWALYHTWKEADDRKTEPTQNQHIQSVESVGEDRKTEPQTDCTNCDQVGRCERGRAVECPLTERSK